MVTYQTKATDENGKVKRDDRGEIIWKNVEYDIRNKTYEQLPEELKEVFNGYQLEIAVQFLLCYNNLATATKLKFWLATRTF